MNSTIKLTRNLAAATSLALLLVGCSSGLDRAVQQDIDSQVRGQSKAIAACYARALAKDHKLAGQMVLSFRVTEQGNFEEAAVLDSQVADPALNQCVLQHTGKLALTRKLETPVLVTCPVQFRLARR